MKTKFVNGRILMYEQDLPKMTDKEYSEWFKTSILVDFVRMGEVFPKVDKKEITAEDLIRLYNEIEAPYINRFTDKERLKKKLFEQGLGTRRVGIQSFVALASSENEDEKYNQSLKEIEEIVFKLQGLPEILVEHFVFDELSFIKKEGMRFPMTNETDRTKNTNLLFPNAGVRFCKPLDTLIQTELFEFPKRKRNVWQKLIRFVRNRIINIQLYFKQK